MNDKSKKQKKFKKKMLKFRLMEFHKEIIKKGKYMEAKKILVLLIKEKLPLGLNDSDYYLEEYFQEIGCRHTVLAIMLHMYIYSLYRRIVFQTDFFFR